jgi:hypothetical protein
MIAAPTGRILVAVLLVMSLGLTGCSGMKVSDFEESEPRLLIEEYFDGRTRAWGIFEDRFGTLRRQFVVDIEGTWDGREVVLKEDFVFSDGEEDHRTWRITKIDEHRYEGRANDVVGVAEGESRGNALNWSYNIDLRMGDDTLRVRFDDWMFLQPDGVLMNRARVSKWGFEIGQVTLTFMKDEAQNADFFDIMERQHAVSGAAVAAQ